MGFKNDWLNETITKTGHAPDGCGMSTRPAYYSGRGVNTGDLNEEHLGKIYRSIKKNAGDEAAEAFVQMVKDMTFLNATDFLLNLHRLEGNGFQWDESLLGGENGVYTANETEGWGTLLAAFIKTTPPAIEFFLSNNIRLNFLFDIARETGEPQLLPVQEPSASSFSGSSWRSRE